MVVLLFLECLQPWHGRHLPKFIGSIVTLLYQLESFPDIQIKSRFLKLEPIITLPALWDNQHLTQTNLTKWIRSG